MKKYLMFLVLFAATMVVLPVKTLAQYSPYIYNGGAILSHALSSQRAADMRGRGRRNRYLRRSSNHKHHRRAVRRKHRRVSMLDNPIFPKFKFDADLPRRSDIV